MLQFYGLREQPFGTTPNPRFLYPSETHRRAQAYLSLGIENQFGFTALIAPPGLGKTTLLFDMLTKYRDKAQAAFVFTTQCSSLELFRYIVTDLQIPGTEDEMDPVKLHHKFAQFAARNAGPLPVLIIIDEAQNLDPSALETVRLLSDFETPDRKLLHIVLAGQPQLEETLRLPGLSQLLQRITNVTRLTPLSAKESASYIDYRLRLAGFTNQQLFTEGAIAKIAAESGGVPRAINRICLNALQLGFLSQRKIVGVDMIERAMIGFGFDEPAEESIESLLASLPPMETKPELMPQFASKPQLTISQRLGPKPQPATAASVTAPSLNVVANKSVQSVEPPLKPVPVTMVAKPADAKAPAIVTVAAKPAGALNKSLPVMKAAGTGAVSVEQHEVLPEGTSAFLSHLQTEKRAEISLAATKPAAPRAQPKKIKVWQSAGAQLWSVGMSIVVMGLAVVCYVEWRMTGSPVESAQITAQANAPTPEAQDAESANSVSEVPSVEQKPVSLSVGSGKSARKQPGTTRENEVRRSARQADSREREDAVAVISTPSPSVQGMASNVGQGTQNSAAARNGNQMAAASIPPNPADRNLPPESYGRVLRLTDPEPSAEADDKPTLFVRPKYPPQARDAHLSGVVTLDVSVSPQGRVSGISVVSGNPVLVQSATTAVWQWRYRPRYQNGNPASATYHVKVWFHSDGNERN